MRRGRGKEGGFGLFEKVEEQRCQREKPEVDEFSVRLKSVCDKGVTRMGTCPIRMARSECGIRAFFEVKHCFRG